MQRKISTVSLYFKNALCYTNEGIDDSNEAEDFNSAMQYISFENNSITSMDLIEATERCSLVRSTYQILARGKNYNELAINGMDSTFLQSLNGINKNATWCIRLRDYRDMEEGIPRFGRNIKSPLVRERQAILEMKELVLQFAGKVDLSNPDVKLYILEGLQSNHQSNHEHVIEEKILAIRLAEGPKVRLLFQKKKFAFKEAIY